MRLSTVFLSMVLMCLPALAVSHVPPDLSAVIAAVAAEKCREDQPNLALIVEKAFSQWEAQNEAAVASAEGQADFMKVKADIRKDMDRNGPYSEKQCLQLINQFKGEKD